VEAASRGAQNTTVSPGGRYLDTSVQALPLSLVLASLSLLILSTIGDPDKEVSALLPSSAWCLSTCL
jgi:hypothetical protein